MKKTLLFILCASVLLLSAQESALYLKHVGFEKDKPVFMHVVKNENGINPQLIQIDETTNKVEILKAIPDYRAVFDYQDGSLIAANSQKKIILETDGKSKEFIIDEDPQIQKNFESGMSMSIGFMGISSLRFSKDGQSIYIPPQNGPFKKYDVVSGKISETNISGLGPIYPVEAGNYFYFLNNKSTGNGFELNQVDLSSQSQKMIPIDIAGGKVGLLFHPDGESLLFVRSGNPYAYHVELNKYQKLIIPEIPVSRRSEFFSDFEKIYFSKAKSEWRYATIEGGNLVTKSLGISLSENAFSLSSEDINKISVSLNEIAEAEGKMVTAGAQNKTFQKQLEPYAVSSSEPFGDESYLESVSFSLGNLEEDYATGASITFYKVSDQALILSEGTYELSSLDKLYEGNAPKLFAQILISIQGDFYGLSEDTEGFVEVIKAEGTQVVDLIFNIKNLQSYGGERLNVAGAFKHRE